MEALAAAAWDSTAFGRYVPPPRARAAHTSLVSLLATLRSQPADNTQVARDVAQVRTMYDSILRDRYDRPEPRLADLDQLQTIAAGFPDRATFLSALALEPPSSTQDFAGASAGDTDDTLVLSTVHSAKGKEWDAVFIISAVDGLFPSTRSLGSDDDSQEERRLMYVAMTRARNHLSV
ncbi:MAG: 3'-5' exonuclease, partial [Gemmatimonadaceae bacterium]